MLVEAVLTIIGAVMFIIGSKREKRFLAALGMIILSVVFLVFICKYGFAISDNPISMSHRMEILTEIVQN